MFDVQNATAFIGFLSYDNRDALFSDQPQSIGVCAFLLRSFAASISHGYTVSRWLLLLATLVDTVLSTVRPISTSWTNF